MSSSVAVSSRRLRPSAAWRTPLSGEVQREPADPEQAVERVADAQRAELPGLLEQPLHRAGEAQDRDQQEEEADDAEAGARARGRREDVLDRLGAAAGELVAVDDAVGRALAPELRGHGAGEDGQGDRGRERAGGQGDRAVEARHLLKAVDDAQHELRPQPERQRPHDALAVHAADAACHRSARERRRLGEDAHARGREAGGSDDTAAGSIGQDAHGPPISGRTQASGRAG